MGQLRRWWCTVTRRQLSKNLSRLLFPRMFKTGIDAPWWTGWRISGSMFRPLICQRGEDLSLSRRVRKIRCVCSVLVGAEGFSFIEAGMKTRVNTALKPTENRGISLDDHGGMISHNCLGEATHTSVRVVMIGEPPPPPEFPDL